MAAEPYTVGLVGFEPERFLRLENMLQGFGFPVRLTPLARDVANCIQSENTPVLIGIAYPCRQETLAGFKAALPATPIIVFGRDESQETAIAMIKSGADDYVCDRRCDAEILTRLEKYFVATNLACSGAAVTCESQAFGWVGNSPQAQNIWRMATKVAPSRSTIMIEGATGTGKDVVALSIHRLSKRANAPLVTMNCAAIPDALIEGELFGYRKGAFTGAVSSYAGKFRLAHGGTLFLDEVGELSLAAQAKLLRAIESRQISPLGSDANVDVDVRILAATNQNLELAVKQGRFRADLYFRLAVVRFHLPSLADRQTDIAPIALYLLSQIASESGAPCPEVADEFMARLEAYHWPGNVRELRNVMEHAFVTSDDPVRLLAKDLPEKLRNVVERLPCIEEAQRTLGEREQLVAALVRNAGRKSDAAKSLNCSRMTLYRRLERAGIDENMIAAAMTPSV